MAGAGGSDGWLPRVTNGSPAYGNVHRSWLESAGTALPGVPFIGWTRVTRWPFTYLLAPPPLSLGSAASALVEQQGGVS